MSSNIWKQFSSAVTSDYYTTKYHNILNVRCAFSLHKTWVAGVKGVQIKRSGLGQIRSNSTLLLRPAFIFWHLPYNKVRHIALMEAPQSESHRPISRGRKERGLTLDLKSEPKSIWLPLLSSACVFHLATGILRRCTVLLPEPRTHFQTHMMSLRFSHYRAQMMLRLLGSFPHLFL